MLEFDLDGWPAIDRAGFARLGRDLQARLLSRVVQAVGGRDHPPRRDRLERAAARLSRRPIAASREKARISRLSECRLMLRQVPGSRRLRWIVRPENGRKEQKRASPSFRLHFSLAARRRVPSWMNPIPTEQVL